MSVNEDLLGASMTKEIALDATSYPSVRQQSYCL